MVEAWTSTPIDHQRAVLAAMTQVGVPYRTNTSQEGVGFDCSGLTTYAWAKAGVQLVRQSGQQINDALPARSVDAKAGDLVQYPGHVMMYLGVGDAIIHSVQRGRTVEIDTISASPDQLGPLRRSDGLGISQEWMAPVPSRSDGTSTAGALGDDLGADRHRCLLGSPGADVEPDR